MTFIGNTWKFGQKVLLKESELNDNEKISKRKNAKMIIESLVFFSLIGIFYTYFDNQSNLNQFINHKKSNKIKQTSIPKLTTLM